MTINIDNWWDWIYSDLTGWSLKEQPMLTEDNDPMQDVELILTTTIEEE